MKYAQAHKRQRALVKSKSGKFRLSNPGEPIEVDQKDQKEVARIERLVSNGKLIPADGRSARK